VPSQADIFSSLRIPDPIRFLPPYDGNPNKLHDLINNVEEILISIRDTDKTPYGRTLWRAIRQKLEGKAEDAIHTAGAGLNWNEIKDALILFCADKRDVQALMAELYGLAHAQLPIQILFKKICEIKTALFKLLDTLDLEPIPIRSKKEFFGETCLNIFTTGIKGPLGLAVRSMRPTNLQEAFQWAMKERDICFQENKRKQETRVTDYKRQMDSRGYLGNRKNNYDPRYNERKRDHKQYSSNDRDYSPRRKYNMKAIMPKDNQNDRSYEPRKFENLNSNKNRGSVHNIEQDSEKYTQNSQLHNIDEDSNFPQSASRDRQDT